MKSLNKILLVTIMFVGCANEIKEQVLPDLPEIRSHFHGIDPNGYDRFFVDFSHRYPDSMTMAMSVDSKEYGNEFKYEKIECLRYSMFATANYNKYIKVRIKQGDSWFEHITKVKE